jgi:hypothetical protein
MVNLTPAFFENGTNLKFHETLGLLALLKLDEIVNASIAERVLLDLTFRGREFSDERTRIALSDVSDRRLVQIPGFLHEVMNGSPLILEKVKGAQSDEVRDLGLIGLDVKGQLGVI